MKNKVKNILKKWARESQARLTQLPASARCWDCTKGIRTSGFVVKCSVHNKEFQGDSLCGYFESGQTISLSSIYDASPKKCVYQKINWSPFAINILDANLYHLCTPDGAPVEFKRSGMGFTLIVNGKRYETDDNLQMSYWMNQNEVGGVLK